MPTADGRFKGISVPDLPWQKEEPEIVGRKMIRPVHRSSFTAAHMLDGETRFNPDGPEIFDRHGLRLNGFGEVEVDQQPPDTEA